MFGKILAGIIVVSLIIPCAYAYIPGDTNGDSLISLPDVIYLVNYIFRSGKPPVPSIAGDVNSTCSISLADAIGLVNYIFRAVPIQGCPEWGPAENLGSPPNSENCEYNPSISSDGQVIYIAAPGTGGFEDIYKSIWNGTSWSQPVKLNSYINSSLPEQTPFISVDGKRLYFASYGRQGGYGQFDIWVSEWDTLMNDWGPVANLGPNINSAGIEYAPCVSTDEKTLFYFSSDPPYRYGIHKSNWTETGWGPAIPLSYNVNASDANNPSISSDGLTLYYDRGSVIYGR